MKKHTSFLLTLTMALTLLSGCGAGQRAATVQTEPYAAPVAASVETAPPPSTAPASTAPTEEGFRFAEPGAIDDSGSFPYDYYDPRYSEMGYYNLESYFLGEVYPAHLAQFLDQVEILDAALVSNPIRGYGLGWVCFTGIPKRDLGWQTVEYKGQTAYCRGLYFRTGDGESYQMQKSYAMEPAPLMDTLRKDTVGNVYQIDRVVAGLESAQLYLPDSGEDYTLTDPAALRELEAAFSYGSRFYYGWSVGAAALPGVAPLLLRFADGETGVVYVAADGSNSCFLWGDWKAYATGKSLFQLMGVDREAAGYVTRDDGSVETTTADKERVTREPMPGDEIPTFHVFYDADGLRIRDINEFETFQGTRVVVHSYRYDEIGNLVEDSVTVDGEPSSLYTAVYAEDGRLLQLTTDMLAQGKYFHEYRYDEQGRLTAIVFHNGDGSEGLPSGNLYYWYDQLGHRRQYSVDENGNLVGGPEGESGENPIRR